MKKFLAIILALVMAVSLIACGNTADDKQDEGGESEITLGFCGMTMNNEYHIVVANGAKAEAEAQGVNILIQAGSEHASVDEQIAILENYISEGVDGIILVPTSSDGLYNPLKECKEKGIPVIILDTDVSEQVQKDLDWDLPYFGTNNFDGAKLAGEWVAKNYEKGTKTAILTGVEGQTNAVDRYEGFLEGVGADYLDIVATQTANWETDQGYTAVQNILTANPDLKLVFCCNDGMAYGALAAIKDANLEGKVDIIGYDGQSQALQYVIDGSFVLDIAQHPADMGRLGVSEMMKILNGGAAEQYINTGTGVIDKTNAQEYYDDYMQYVD